MKSEPEPLEGQRVLNLAEQFIAAMPARIKNEGEGDALMLDISNQNNGSNYGTNSNLGSTCSPLICDTSQSDDLGIESMGDDLDFEFDLIQVKILLSKSLIHVFINVSILMQISLIINHFNL